MTSEQAARLIVYARSQGRCEVCTRPADSVHHRNKQGRLWDPSNLLHLCGDGTRWCHAWIEQNPTHAIALGLWVPRHLPPETVPAYCHPTMFWRSWWMLDDDGCWVWAGDPPPDHPATPARQAAVLSLTTTRNLAA